MYCVSVGCGENFVVGAFFQAGWGKFESSRDTLARLMTAAVRLTMAAVRCRLLLVFAEMRPVEDVFSFLVYR